MNTSLNKNILIGITSSIAAYKIYELIRLYKKNGYNVKIVTTKNALNFVSPLVLETLSENKCFYNQFEPRDNVEHISLATWTDIFVIAPSSANTISKCAQGIADNLLTSVFCAYLGYKKPILFAPAMNTGMWENPIIQENILKLKKLNCDFVEPQNGFLACGTEGKGKLADVNLIYHQTLRNLHQNKNNNSKKIIVTMGGTKEKIDSVRYITNSSSGKMGTAIADWAYYFGFEVNAISTIELERNYKTTKVNSAIEMLNQLQNQDYDYLIMAAAVGDFKVQNESETKISKEEIEGDFCLKLTKNPDVVATIAKNKKENQKIIGFCLTDKDLINCAKNKLINKNLDYIIANDVKTALNTNQNKVTIIEKSGKIIDIDLDTKENIAKKILEVVCD
ncbi:MAG: bifunctional phosphopantothenoylcysteine decarboxylase/phosphopantothenate--cysteine ligase CoaBC [Candidatus Gastranaerophilales bacterium]|nr:bifunctional phosphopantothenoylcysteine decarboxylase/phosphopantothenate--cysteine ligase CoaBC [Candidatus Gastranaerophilales bacterium]